MKTWENVTVFFCGNCEKQGEIRWPSLFDKVMGRVPTICPWCGASIETPKRTHLHPGNHYDKLQLKIKCPFCKMPHEHEQGIRVWLPEYMRPEDVHIKPIDPELEMLCELIP